MDLFSEGKPKKQALLSQYFMKNLGLLQMNQQKRTASTAADSVGWTVSQKATKAEIIATMQFAANNVPFHRLTIWLHATKSNSQIQK